MIQVNSASDVRVACGNRYFIIRNIHGDIQVVSAATSKELSPYRASDGTRRYKFATTTGGYQNLYSQEELRQIFNSRAKIASAAQVSNLMKVSTLAAIGSGPTQVGGLVTEEAVFAGGYIIGTVTSMGISTASNPKVHVTEALAEAEANRLASANPGTEFVVFKATMSAIKATVVTRKF